MRHFFEYFNMALKNIIANRTRSLLTMLGIIIGIGSVIMIVGIAQSEQRSLQGSMSDTSATLSVLGEGATSADAVTLEDIDAIKAALPDVQIAPSASVSGVAYGSKTNAKAQISMETPDALLISPPELVRGRAWSEDAYYGARRSAVIDQNGAYYLFGNDNVVGLTLMIEVEGRREEFTITGVEKSFSSYAPDAPAAVAVRVPLTAMVEITENHTKHFTTLTVHAKEPGVSAAMAQQAANLLARRHNNEDKDLYRVSDLSGLSGMLGTLIEGLGAVITAVAAISLVVGGIGVMNIMLVSVTERTREIGIRKALGAKTKTIELQFLIESATLTLVGGIIGILFGLGGAWLASVLMQTTLYISPLIVVGVAAFSSAIGIFFGISPAKKAAKMNPIEALRAE